VLDIFRPGHLALIVSVPAFGWEQVTFFAMVEDRRLYAVAHYCVSFYYGFHCVSSVFGNSKMPNKTVDIDGD
jgi:hypothetical protein